MSVLKQISNNWIFVVPFLFAIAFISPVNAQQRFFFNRVVPPDGSRFGLVNSISQDSLGYLWLAIFEGGLIRYDGYNFKTYLHDSRDEASLADNKLEAVYAARNGYIWTGSQLSGLDRLDPATGKFTHFRYKEGDPGSLSDDWVTEILEDHLGNIWVGTINGLNMLEPKTGTFTRYQQNDKDSGSLSANNVQELYEDRSGTLWVGTGSPNMGYSSDENGGLNRFDRKNNKFIRYMHDPKNPTSLIDNRVGAIFEDSKGIFWVSTAKDGLHTMDRSTGKFKRYFYDPVHPERLSGPPRKKGVALNLHNFFLRGDGAGNVWIGSSGGWITCYDPVTGKAEHYDSFKEGTVDMEAVSGAFTSREGILWMRTWDGHIYRVDPFQGIFRHYFTGSIVHEVHEDPSGALWLRTFEKGLVRVERESGRITKYSMPAGPFSRADPYVNILYEGIDSTLWIGSENLIRYNRKRQLFNRYVNDPKNENSLSKGSIQAILQDKAGFIWIGTSGGLDLFDITTGVFRHFRNDLFKSSSLCNDTITSLLKDDEGNLWVGTKGGLDYFDTRKGVFKHFRNQPSNSNSISHNSVTFLLMDHTGNLWIGTGRGILNLFDPRTGNFKRFPYSGQIGSKLIDSDNILWIGTSTGLYRREPGVDSFLRFTDPGIVMYSTTVITGILEDDQKNIWVGSTAGIFRYNRKQDEISVYNRNQGVDATTLAYLHMKGAKGGQGEFYFACSDGFYAFFPDQFKSNTTPPQIVISDFQLADHPVAAGTGSLLNLPILSVKKIRLNHEQNVFSFDIAGIHFGSPEDNQLFYMLENLDNDWRKADHENRARYYNVPPGRYVFHVKAASRDGVWAEKAITVIINPPWYRTWWALMMYIIGIAVIIWIFTWQRSRQLKAENILLEEKVTKRTKELEESLEERYKLSKKVESQQALLNERLRISRELHDDIGSTLGSISIYSEVAKKRTEKNEDPNEVLLKIGLASRELIDKMSDIVWSLNPDNESFEQLQNRMMAFAAMILAPRNIPYDFISGEGLNKLQFTGGKCKNFFLIFKEVLHNIVKYSDCNTVNISLSEQNNDLVMKIQDDGKGFDTSQPVANEIRYPDGYLGGNGIKNMNARADEMNALLCINSKINEGTTVQLTIHLYRDDIF